MKEQAKIGNKISKNLATPWGLTFECKKTTCTKKTMVCFNIIWLVTMKMRMIMKKITTIK